MWLLSRLKKSFCVQGLLLSSLFLGPPPTFLFHSYLTFQLFLCFAEISGSNLQFLSLSFRRVPFSPLEICVPEISQAQGVRCLSQQCQLARPLVWYSYGPLLVFYFLQFHFTLALLNLFRPHHSFTVLFQDSFAQVQPWICVDFCATPPLSNKQSELSDLVKRLSPSQTKQSRKSLELYTVTRISKCSKGYYYPQY